MSITADEVRHIATLSRLKLSDEEIDLFRRQLSDILSYVEKLNELPTLDVVPTSHVLPLENVFREDVVTESLARDKALANAPDATETFYRVPSIIEEQ